MWLLNKPHWGLIQLQTNLVFLLICFWGHFSNLLYDAAVRCKCQHKQGGGTNDWGQKGGQKGPPFSVDILIYAAGWRSWVTQSLKTCKRELLPCTGTRVCQKGDWQHHWTLNGSSFWLPVQSLLTSFVLHRADVCEVWYPSPRKLFNPFAVYPVVQGT